MKIAVLIVSVIVACLYPWVAGAILYPEMLRFGPDNGTAAMTLTFFGIALYVGIMILMGYLLGPIGGSMPKGRDGDYC